MLGSSEPKPLSLLDAIAHRPWPPPGRPWIVAQRWQDLLFAHWRVPPEALAARLPPGLVLQTFDGSAWLALVPFRMAGVRGRGLPRLPGLSAFAELNLRTYVERDGRPGVWFFSLDAAQPLAVRAARAAFHLPYMDADMTCRAEGEALRYRSSRTHRGEPPARFEGSYGPDGAVFAARPGSLEHWLTERYCLYAADPANRLYRAEVHHRPWPLQPAWAEFQENTMASPLGLDLDRPPDSLLFSRDIEVVAWWRERL
jgi:hypothetical protein